MGASGIPVIDELHHIGDTYCESRSDSSPRTLSDQDVKEWLEGYVVKSAKDKQIIADKSE